MPGARTRNHVVMLRFRPTLHVSTIVGRLRRRNVVATRSRLFLVEAPGTRPWSGQARVPSADKPGESRHESHDPLVEDLETVALGEAARSEERPLIADPVSLEIDRPALGATG